MVDVTPNLELKVINTETDGNLTFNIDEYIGDNFNKIDTFAGNAAIKPVEKTAILSSGSWTLNGTTGFYEYTLSDTDITASTRIEIIVDDDDYENAINAVLMSTDSSDGSVLIKAKSQPVDSSDNPVDIGITYYIEEVA